MTHLIDKDAVVAEIKKEIRGIYAGREYVGIPFWEEREIDGLEKAIEILNTLEVKEVDLTDGKTNWCPSKKQMESLHDLLKYNIGVFDYKKCMEVNSLYEDLTKILDYETDRQK